MRVRRRLGDWPDYHREDVEQTCFVRLLAVVNDAERVARIVRLEAYCQRLIDNAINDAIREHATLRDMVLLPGEIEEPSRSGEADPADLAADNEIAAGLHLTPKQMQLLELRQRLGSTSAVAEALNISTQRASERISRLVRAMREQRHAIAA
jgi:RNA polymerase sigma factor (sigma-70 family)